MSFPLKTKHEGAYYALADRNYIVSDSVYEAAPAAGMHRKLLEK